MSLSTLINRPCVILRRQTAAGTTPYGRRRKTDTMVETVCELQQASSVEPGDGGEIAATDWRLFFLPDTDLRTGDAVVVDGHTYELTGDPWPARNPLTQVVSHLEATAQRTAGTEETGS